MFYKNSQAVILCFDITKKQTFDDIQTYWLNEMQMSLAGEQVFSMALLGMPLMKATSATWTCSAKLAGTRPSFTPKDYK